MRLYIFFLYFVCSTYLFSQSKNSISDVNQLLNLSEHYLGIDYEKSLYYSEKAIKETQNSNDSEKKAIAYFLAAKSFVFYRDFDNANKYIEKGYREEAVQNNDRLHVLYLILKSAYYSRMSLFNQSLFECEKGLKIINSKNDLHSKVLKSIIYALISDYYNETGNYEKANIFIDKSLDIIEKIPEHLYSTLKKRYKVRHEIYFFKSWLSLLENNAEEAFPYVKKGYEENNVLGNNYKAPFLEVYADYYYQTKQYLKAIDFYNKTVENKIKFKHKYAFVDSKIALCYKMLGDKKKATFYLERSLNQHTIDIKDHTKIIQEEYNRILKNKEREKSNLRNKNLKIVYSIIFLFITFSVALIFRLLNLSRIKLRKRRIIDQQSVMISDNEVQIKEKIEQVEILTKKVNGSFTELIELVKSNSPNFWGRFQEIHPQFCEKMLSLNPQLKISELTYCAYIYLGLSTKEIAEYTFKAQKTIENNRYNFRKRIGITPKEDLYTWIRKYLEDI